MNRKTYIPLLVLLVVLILGIIYFDTPKTPESKKVYEMSGTVTRVDTNYITVSGKVDGVERVVGFNISPQTLVNKRILKITKEQVASGKPFTPQLSLVPGQLTDVKVSTQIAVVKSSDNLNTAFSTPKNATEIDYLVKDLPK